MCILILVAPVSVVAAEPLIQLGTDPYPNSTSRHRTNVEPDSFSYGSTVVSAFQVGRFFSGGASNMGWATSTDQGRSWKRGFLPKTTAFAGGRYDRVSDPTVAYDAQHKTWMISYLGIFAGGRPVEPVNADVVVSLSQDGLHWSPPVIIAKGISGHNFYDKNWTVCDNWKSSPFYGNCYTQFDDAATQPFDLILMSTSANGGRSWGPSKPTADRGHGIGGQPVVQPSGKVIVPLVGFPTPHIEQMESFWSANGGKRWSPTVRISSMNVFFGPANVRNPELPSAEIDRSGRVYVAWQDCRFEPNCSANDIVFSTSTNGQTWSSVRRIPIDPLGSGIDHFTPGIAVDRTTPSPSAHIALTYYYFTQAGCTTATCNLNVGFISSANGGRTWGGKRHLAGPMKLSSLALTSQGYMYGDYISTSMVGSQDRGALPFFVKANPKTGDILHEFTFTTREEIGITGGGVPLETGAGTPLPSGQEGRSLAERALR